MKLFPGLLLLCFFLVIPIRSWGSSFLTVGEIRDNVRQNAIDLQHKDLRVRLSAIEGLQSWSSYATEAVPALIKGLKDENPEVRAGSAHTLELIGPPAKSAVSALTQALSDRAAPVRAAAAFALGQIGTQSMDTLSALQIAEKNSPPRVKLAVAFALQRLFPHQVRPLQDRREIAKMAAPLLMSSLSRPRGFETVRLARAIGNIDSATGFSLVPRLVELAYNKEPTISSNASHAIETLGKVSTAFIPAVLQSAQRGPDEKRVSAIRQLGWMRASTPETVSVLKKSLSSGSVNIRMEAAEALGRIGTADQPAIRELSRLIHSSEEPERRSAAFALLKVSPETLDELMPHLKKRDPKLAKNLEMYRLLKDL